MGLSVAYVVHSSEHHSLLFPGLLGFTDSVIRADNMTTEELFSSWNTSVHPCNDYAVECAPCYDEQTCPRLDGSASEYCAWFMVGCKSGSVSSLSIPLEIELSSSLEILSQVKNLETIRMVLASKSKIDWDWLSRLESLQTIMLMLGNQHNYGQVSSLPEWNTTNHVLEDLALANANISGDSTS